MRLKRNGYQHTLLNCFKTLQLRTLCHKFRQTNLTTVAKIQIRLNHLHINLYESGPVVLNLLRYPGATGQTRNE